MSRPALSASTPKTQGVVLRSDRATRRVRLSFSSSRQGNAALTGTVTIVDEVALKEMAEHVTYEVWMLTCASELLNEPTWGIADESGEVVAADTHADIVVLNAVVESRCYIFVHCTTSSPDRQRTGDTMR